LDDYLEIFDVFGDRNIFLALARELESFGDGFSTDS
jgi:hypothetical protein